MKDKLAYILTNVPSGLTIDEFYSNCSIEELADHLLANNVFVLPEKMKDSLELALPFMMRLFVADEAEMEKIKGEFEFSQKKKILTDIRDYLVKRKAEWGNEKCEINQIMGLGVEVFVDKALADLTEYAEKLGVEL